MTEAEIQRDIMLEFGTWDDIRLWRNQVGGLYDKRGVFVPFGLTKGSADLIGLKSIVVTKEMIGKRLAVFVSIEVKRPMKKPTKLQSHWRAMIEKLGGISGIARSVEDAWELLTRLP